MDMYGLDLNKKMRILDGIILKFEKQEIGENEFQGGQLGGI